MGLKERDDEVVQLMSRNESIASKFKIDGKRLMQPL